MRGLFSNKNVCSDLSIRIPQSNNVVQLHRIVLCMAAEWFRNLLLKRTASAEKELIESLSVHQDQDTTTTNGFEALKHFLDFVYTFEFKLDGKSDRLVVHDVYKIAKRCQLSELVECCENVLSNQDYLNIETCKTASERRRQMIRQLFVNKPLLSDVIFLVEDKRFYAHKAVVMARSDVMAAMLGGGFKEGSTEREVS